MKLPTELKIGEHVYRIVFMSELDESLAGICYLNDKVILVSLDQTKAEVLASTIHEVLHAIEREYGIKMGHKIINKLEWALAQVVSQLAK